MRFACLALALLAGCSPWSIARRPLDPPGDEGVGHLEIRLDSERNAALGYSFSIRHPDGRIDSCYLVDEAPVAVKELKPGRYEIEVRDPRSGRATCEVKVRRQSETRLIYAPGSASSASTSTVAEFGVVTGKTVFYATVGAIYLLAGLTIEWVFGSDDDDDADIRASVQPCPACGQSPCQCSRKEPPRNPPKDEPKPRVKDILKNP